MLKVIDILDRLKRFETNGYNNGDENYVYTATTANHAA
jgi:hypothetical protein